MPSVIPFRRPPARRKSGRGREKGGAQERSALGFPLIVAALFLGVFTAVFAWDGQSPEGQAATPGSAQAGSPSGTAITAMFNPCLGGSRMTCVVDGDTIWAEGTKIRMADYNTPETGSPGCDAERELGERATSRLTELLNSGEVTLHAEGGRDTDQYGRALRVVKVDGRSVGDTLVAEGLAHEWEGYRREWC